MLSLKEAIKLGKLTAFIRQEEARGVGPINEQEFDSALSSTITRPQSVDQTSRSLSRGGLTEK